MRRVATTCRSFGFWLTLLAITAMLSISVMPATAQVSAGTGTVTGIITDPSGAVVPGAKITLTDVSTHTSRTSSTTATGRYIFTSVDPGSYTLMVSKSGFSNAQVAAQDVKVGVTTTVNVPLQIGQVSQTVEVKTTGTELQTMNATVGNTVTGVALQSLPSLNRDVSTFITLQPGVSPDGSVAGTVVDQSTFQLDGGQNTNDMDGSMSVYTPSFAGDPTAGISNQSNFVAAGATGVVPTPADSVEQFKVNTAGQTADFNSSAGAQVQVVTKRGTNQFHGSLYEYYLDNNFSANTWDNVLNGVPVPNWHRSRFGGSIGGPLLPTLLGGKTYFFANYEGYRWPNSKTIERAVPSADMRAGFLTFGGVRYDVRALDPRGIGINPLMSQIWNKFMPPANETTGCGLSRCDGVNIQGFKANVGVPQTSNFGVFRLDHDFGSKWHFMSSLRYFDLRNAGTQQNDIGGFFAGDKLGVPTSLSNNPQKPWFLVAGMTTNVTSNVTNDFHYSYLRNWWAWARAGDVPQLAGLGGALEPFGETSTQALIPFNVNTQQTRTRVWNGKDNYFRDDVSWLRGNHLFQFGGAYQRNENFHSRTDNGGGINYQPVYQLGTTAGSGIDITLPAGFSGSSRNFGRDLAAMLGVVSIAQQAFIRAGSDLRLQPFPTQATNNSIVPYYNLYASDTWHVKPSFTVTYGLGWTLEMPPFSTNHAQMVLVDQSNKLISAEDFLRKREQAALQGQVFNPTVGFSLISNTGRKYPYDPYYKEFSPRVALAWNPHFSGDSWLSRLFGENASVIRGGYNRIYGRLNGVDLVLVPLLAPGIIQPVQCFGPTNAGVCAGPGAPTLANAFRIGVDGLTAPLSAGGNTLPQPYLPGINAVSAAAGEALDPNFRPNSVDTFDLTYQRQLSSKVTMEMGYIGRIIRHEYQPLNIDAVPYMMTRGGQRFDKAYANMVLQYCGGLAGLAASGCAQNLAAVTPQPFFESALAGTGYCNGFANCTQALAFNEGNAGTGNIASGGNYVGNVWSMWSDLDTGGLLPGFNFPRSMQNSPFNCPTGVELGCSGQLTSGVGVNSSVGHGNYNAGFISIRMSNWHGLTTQSNFTWSKALSTQAVVQATSEDTAVDPYHIDNGYGLAGYDRKFVYNLFFVYQPEFYKSQHGLLGHALGGWTIAPIFTAGTGVPITLGSFNGGGQAFGEGDSVNFFANGISENAVPMGHISTGIHNTNGSNGVGDGGFGVNLFSNPEAAYALIRQPILGLDTRNGGAGILRGLNYWNVDMSVSKDIRLTERVGLAASAVFTNVFNHVVFFDPGSGDLLDTSTPSTWGTLPGQGNNPRQMEFGLRLTF